MSTDSTELTFVRCPSCRSLVPAVSTRCRMCGAALDPTQRSEDSVFDQRKSGRVRQRTLSQPESDLESAADQLRDEMSGPEEETGMAEENEPAALFPGAGVETEIDPTADPLSAYIEEVAMEETAGAPEEAAAEPPPAAPAPAEPAAPSPDEPRNGATHREAAPPPAPEPKKEAAPAEQGGGSPPSETQSSAEQRARVIIETGGRRGGKGGLSFGRQRDEQRAQEQRPREERPREESRPQREDHRRDEHRQREEPRQREEQHSHGAPRHEQSRGGQTQPQRFDRERDRDRDRGDRRNNPPPRREEGAPGRLCGWLVSYADPKGVATELREGRFFFTRSSLKEADMVVDDDSVSTPHALITITGSGDSVKVQDLLSDRGVHMRRRNGDSFQRISDTVNLEHGDSIRFGEVEYLLCLVAKPGSNK